MQAFELFERMSTQWRIGAAGPSGLDYGTIPTILQLSGVPQSDWPPLFDDLRIMEDSALTVIHESKK